MIYWAQLFHFYQPPTQIPVVLEKICNESYKPLLKVLLQNPHARATLNINGVLLEMLHDCGHRDVIKSLRALEEKGEVEFTGSGKYHPILPLLPQGERKRQIELNIATGTHFLGKTYQPKGFFPPEMCYSDDILSEVIATDHQWVIVGGVACPAPWPIDKIYQVEHNGKRLAVFFRDDVLSNKISFKQIGANDFLEHLKQVRGDKENVYVVTAMDAETYGHHIQNWEKLFLASVYEKLSPTRKTYAGIKQTTALGAQQRTLLADAQFAQQVKMVTVSELLQIFPAGEVISPKPSSWSTSAEDIAAGNPHPLWLDKNNEIHRLQWEHLRLCIEMVNKAQECSDNDECSYFGRIARGLLDMAEHSCQFWWASRRPMWDINLIHLGLMDQWRVIVNAYRAINKSGADGETKKNYYHKLVAARDVRNKIADRLFIL
jgi:alpha-amylase/alpha-mannosidase (GH57 family)